MTDEDDDQLQIEGWERNEDLLNPLHNPFLPALPSNKTSISNLLGQQPGPKLNLKLTSISKVPSDRPITVRVCKTLLRS
jgi:hypothetical protein